MVERTVHPNMALNFKERESQATVNSNTIIDCLDATAKKKSCNSIPKLAQQEIIHQTCMQQDGCNCQQSDMDFALGVATTLPATLAVKISEVQLETMGTEEKCKE